MSEAAVSMVLRHFGVAYDQKIIISDLSWEVHAGRVHLLFGAAGSGKSSLLKALAGWHRRIPSMRVWGSTQIHGSTQEPALVHQSLGAFVSTVGVNLATAMPDRSALTQAQQRIGVHCKAGLGRTGLVLGCVLIELERLSATQSLQRIRSINPRFVQSDEQAEFLERYTP